MGQRTRLSLPAIGWRWLVGMALVSWRYLWATTPLHRTETYEDTPRHPPPVPPGASTDGLQDLGSGIGPIFHRLFRVRIADARTDAARLVGTVVTDLERLVPREVVRVHALDAADRPLRTGDDIVVDMPGPWNGPVRVLAVDDTRLRLATLDGHLEAGQIEFRAYDDPPHLVFEVEAWARPADWKVRLLYARLRLAKEIQLNMWVRVCLAAVRESGGRRVDGVEIRTTVTPA